MITRLNQVKQSLWPQCQSCFQMQGSAVRVNEHRLVYVSGLRLHHVALLLAVAASEQVVESEAYGQVERAVESLFTRVKGVYDKLWTR